MVRDETLRERSRAMVADALLLAGSERTAASYPPALRDDMRALHRAAGIQARAADLLGDGNAPSALELYREAAVLYIAAFVTVRSGAGMDGPLEAREVIARFRALSPVPGAPRELDSFLDELSGDVGAVWPRPSGFAEDARADRARRLVAWLSGLVEPRGVKEIRFARWLRVGVAAAAATVGLAALAWALLSRENVALHKPVTMSAPHPDATFAPGGLTDGVRSESFGVHTSVSEMPWVQVDLLATYLLDTVKVYNRGDSAFDAGLPMTLQLSQNGRDFVDVATRTTHFSQKSPWTIKLPRQPARFVRVRGGRGRYVALSELEAFGEKSSTGAPHPH